VPTKQRHYEESDADKQKRPASAGSNRDESDGEYEKDHCDFPHPVVTSLASSTKSNYIKIVCSAGY